MEVRAVVKELRAMGDPAAVEGMKRFGIRGGVMLGISLPNLRGLAKKVGRDHRLALELWKTGIHDARMLSSMIDDPALVTSRQMDEWASEFDSWDVCDVCCGGLFDRTPFAYAKAAKWSKADAEYLKRAGFALMAALAVHDKEADDSEFIRFFPAIKSGSTDDRNFVRKAVNWALRQIGKRNVRLNKRAVALAEEIRRIDSRSARWVAADALRELRSPQVLKRLGAR